MARRYGRFRGRSYGRGGGRRTIIINKGRRGSNYGNWIIGKTKRYFFMIIGFILAVLGIQWLAGSNETTRNLALNASQVTRSFLNGQGVPPRSRG